MATLLHAHVGYWQRRKAAASERGRRMARVRWARERAERLANPPEVDADTVRWRALHDRMGSILLAGTMPDRGRIEIRHSTKRSNAFEVFLDGRPVASGGKRRIALWLFSL